MKILVFEYISGGGLAGRALPASLAAEGGMMLQALADDLKSLPGLNLLVPLDKRCAHPSLPAGAEIVPIGEDRDAVSRLPELIGQCDAVWPIAPESDGLLASITEMAASQHKTLLSSPSAAVALCGDKLATYQVLSAHRIPAVETCSLLDSDGAFGARRVVKPVDGVGCQGGAIVENSDEFRRAVDSLEYPARHVVQPYCDGRAVSLSCLCKQGKGWLLCCNRQQIEIENQRFVLRGCLVNVQSRYRIFYRHLVERIAGAIPVLWGYIGIDIIETPDRGPLVLEINPRLTTSYAGIRRATGINVAEQVLSLLQSEPDLQQYCNRAVDITIG